MDAVVVGGGHHGLVAAAVAHWSANIEGGTIPRTPFLLVFRPVPGLGRPETPVAGRYLGSAAAHPGGAAGVTGSSREVT